MFDKIRKLFPNDTVKSDDTEASLHLAAAVLLVEVAKSDDSVDDEEILRLRAMLKHDWKLDEYELDGLLGVARDTSGSDAGLRRHIDLINRNFSAARKFELVRSLWRAACADGRIHRREEVFIQRLGDLLEVSHDELERGRYWALESEKSL